jgi:Phage integrase family
VQLPGHATAGQSPATTPSTVVVTIQPAFTDAERVALSGFLAGYCGPTREAYALDLRQFTSWCRALAGPVRRPPCRHRVLRPGSGSHGPRPGPPLSSGADIEHLGLERGHQTLTVTRKGGKVVTVPLAPRTARAIDLAIGERTEGPVFLAADGRRLDRHGAGLIVRKTGRRAGVAKIVTPHTVRHAFITAALDAGVPLGDVQEAASHADPRTR